MLPLILLQLLQLPLLLLGQQAILVYKLRMNPRLLYVHVPLRGKAKTGVLHFYF